MRYLALLAALLLSDASAQPFSPLQFLPAQDAKVMRVVPRPVCQNILPSYNTSTRKPMNEDGNRQLAARCELLAYVGQARQAFQNHGFEGGVSAWHAASEQLANTAYRMVMSGSAGLNAMAFGKAAPGAHRNDLSDTYWSIRETRNELRSLFQKADELRGDVKTRRVALRAETLAQLSSQDARDMLDNETLERYRKAGLLNDGIAKEALTLSETTYKLPGSIWDDKPGHACGGACRGSGWPDCRTCTVNVMENAESAYRDFAARWNAIDRWPLWHVRLYLVDDFLSRLEARRPGGRL